MITVQDNGMGIDPEDTDRVFGIAGQSHLRSSP